MLLNNNTNGNYTMRQLKLPLEIEKLIDISDPAYNIQAAICDEYIAVIDVKPYASDMECFVPLMEKFNLYTQRCRRDQK